MITKTVQIRENDCFIQLAHNADGMDGVDISYHEDHHEGPKQVIFVPSNMLSDFIKTLEDFREDLPHPIYRDHCWD